MDAANLLLDARRTAALINDLPLDLQPATIEEIDLVQDMIAAAYGPIGGWKIGASTPQDVPTFAPMPAAWIAPSGAVLSGIRYRYRGLEAEVAFLVGEELPPRKSPYTREEIIAAMASCHPAIEVLESGLITPATANKHSKNADLQIHGGFIYGPAYADWKTFDFAQESVTLAVEGSVRVERASSRATDEFLRLLLWLANEGAARTGGLKPGQWITTGNWTGNIQTIAGASVDAHFATVGRASLRFA